MAYYLSTERENDCAGAYRRYLDYLRKHKEKFPPSAFALGTENWYQNAYDHKCPHDARVENFTISESRDEKGERSVTILTRLSARYGDGFIELFYPKVFSYNLILPSCNEGHKDWVYDEFRLSESGHVIHEIEWRDYNASWIIEASDVNYKWIPK